MKKRTKVIIALSSLVVALKIKQTHDVNKMLDTYLINNEKSYPDQERKYIKIKMKDKQ